MYRLTTPTITFKLPETVDLTLASNLYVTFATKQQKKLLEKTESELDITAHTVGVFLTQEETKELIGDSVKVQLNWTYVEDDVTKRACSNIVEISVRENLKKEII